MNLQPERSRPGNTKSYEEFLLTEYNNIAKAHFNTVSGISTFFRYYLLIVSLPFPLLALTLKGLGEGALCSLLEEFGVGIPAVATLISVVGLCVMGYIANLRFDAVLYARTVNGIRSYFVQHSGLSLAEELNFRVLPRTAHFPRYIEWPFFGFVILTFALFDTAYFAGGWLWWLGPRPNAVVWGASAVLFLTHLASYVCLARHRERAYLRTHIVGVDIDGVLNEHRPHFCALLKELLGKELDPESITHIPVHELPHAKVTRDDEHAVFNHPRYWTEMPVKEGAADVLKELRNVFRYKVWLFSYRPWPNEDTFLPDRRGEYGQFWDKERTRLERLRRGLHLVKGSGVASWERLHWLLKKVRIGYDNAAPIRRMTRRWLDKCGFTYQKLVVEEGNVDTTDPDILTRNRFVKAKERRIRLFVEDDLFKARKLANICEAVFLIRQPYNRRQYPNDEACPDDWRKRKDPDLPNNVIPVDSWSDIKKYIREVL
jgi:uncharacterized HAD superfamily protein